MSEAQKPPQRHGELPRPEPHEVTLKDLAIDVWRGLKELFSFKLK